MSTDVVELCRELLRIDTSNPGQTEEPAARVVVDRLEAAGVATEVIEAAPGRTTVVSRMRGEDASLPGLVVHTHLDVVPAQEGWTHDPFGGDLDADGWIWGRGAIDMKNCVAMALATQLDLAGSGRRPRRDLVFVYFADEERGGPLGSQWLVQNRPDVFEGCAESLGEVGGYSVTLPDGRRVFPLQVAERGFLWLRVVARGPGGHAALSPPGGNPTVRLAAVIPRIAALETDDPPPPAYGVFLERLAAALGRSTDDPAALAAALGSFGPMALRGARTTFTPTVLHAGVKTNVIPDRAEVQVDARFVPGGRDRALAALRGAIDDDMELEPILATSAAEAPVDGPLPDACAAAIAAFDPDALVLPYVMPGGTDGQNLVALGIRPYGFMPLPLPAGFDFPSLFHAADERVPAASIRSGRELLRDLVASY